MATVELFWEPGSPYTYLAATQVAALESDTGVTVEWKPFLLGKVFQARGMTLPAAVPAKAQYMFKDLARWAQRYQVPLTMPKVFPVNSMLASRVSVAAGQQGKGAEAALAVMGAYWGRGEDISQADVIKAALDGAGLEGDALIAASGTDPVKDQLRQNTEAALERGVFGAPSFFYEGAMFWGNDRLDLLKAVIAGTIRA